MGELLQDSTADVVWPVKRRELVRWVIDSRPWNDFAMRDDDIVITTWAKSGTTWMQQIVGQLIFSGEPDLYCEERSPWIEFRLRDGDPQRHLQPDQVHGIWMLEQLLVHPLLGFSKLPFCNQLENNGARFLCIGLGEPRRTQQTENTDKASYRSN